jgi:hypothetical protein
MLIKLLDFWLRVNRHGSHDAPASALSDGEISAASNDQSRPDQSGWGGPLSKHHDARNNHPDELGVGEWR